MNQYAIRREYSEFLGPLRCHACVSRNSNCVVNKTSRACNGCNSEAECLFTRSIETTGMKRDFSWEELNGVPSSPRSFQQGESRPRPDRSAFEREDPHAQGQPYTMLPALSERPDDIYLTNPSENSSSSTWKPQSTTTPREYSSHGLDDNDEYGSPLSPFAAVAPNFNDNLTPESARTPNQTPGEEQQWRTRNISLPTTNRLPSIRDSLSSLEPRMASVESDPRRSRPSSSFDRNEQNIYNTEMAHSSAETQSIDPSNLAGPNSHDFILETFDTVAGSMESRRGKRRGKLSEDSAVSASQLRAIGACWKCKLQKNQCSTENPCGPCVKSLNAGRYCPPCFRGQLTDLMPWIFWGKSPTPGCTKASIYIRELSLGAQNFLTEAKKQKDELLNIALDLYESESSAEMFDLGGIVLRELENLLYKNKHLSVPQFYCICIIDMVSRAMEIDSSSALTNDDGQTTQDTNSASTGLTVKRNKALEVLFGLIRSTGPYDPFDTICKATGSKKYNRDRHGTHLLSYIEGCLFKLKPTGPRPPQNIESVRMGNPPIFMMERLSLTNTLPDRSAQGIARKRGLSADSQPRRQPTRAAGKQRTAARGQEIEEMDEDSDGY